MTRFHRTLKTALLVLPAAYCAFYAAPAFTQDAPNVDKQAKLKDSLFRAFTGKVKAKKVRVRLHPDLESQIVKELNKNEIISVVGETDQFWAIEAPSEVKSYVFRTFVLDNVVEADHVNVRLEPSLEAPIIAHLNTGDKVNTSPCAQNAKWYEIAPPSQVRFWVAKDLIEYIGGPEVKSQMDKRKSSLDQLLDSATLLSKAEMRKPFEEVDYNRLLRNYNVIIQDYSDFPEAVESAKSSLAALQEAYLQKKIAYLEAKAYATANPAKHLSEEQATHLEHQDAEVNHLAIDLNSDKITDKMKIWQPLEEALFLAWTQSNEDKGFEEYYHEERIDAIALSGIVEAYSAPVKNKPGDFILKDHDVPVAYVYSTQHNLQNYIGKRVTLVASPRPNNNFAFPAYYVHAVE